MTDAIFLSRIPACARLLDEATPVAEWLANLNREADGGVSDDRFTEDNFNDARRNNPLAKDLKRFRHFRDFRAFLEQFVESQRCTPACRKEHERDRPELTDRPPPICIAPPTPELPQIPRRPRPKPKPDISMFHTNTPKWYDEPSPERAKTVRPPAAIIPDMEELFVQAHPLPGSDALDHSTLAGATSPVMNISYDGRDVVLRAHGCYINNEDSDRCVAPWSFFSLELQNETRNNRQRRRADANGDAVIHVPAEPGDRISVHGTDATTGRPSLNRMFFRITQQKTMEMTGEVRSHLDDPSPLDEMNALMGEAICIDRNCVPAFDLLALFDFIRKRIKGD